MGAAGGAIGMVSVAGCGSDTDGGGSDDLPEDRRMGAVNHITTTESHWPARWQSTVFVDDRLNELGIPAEPEGLERGTQIERMGNQEFDIYTWDAPMSEGDPDNVLVNNFATGGRFVYHNWDHEEYNQTARAQREETDRSRRQELVYKCQRLIGEERPESQYLHHENVYAFNSDRIEEDSVVVDTNGLNNIWNWTQMEPRNDDGRTVVTNNLEATNLLNPFNERADSLTQNWRPIRYMHDFLIERDENLDLTAWGAEEFGWRDDTTAFIQVRDDLQFHDGEPLTVDDVLYTFNLILDTEPPGFSRVFDRIDSVEQTGPNEVQFNLPEVYVPLWALTIAETPIVPKHVWEAYLSETGNEETPWELNINDDRPLIGSGPFEYGTWNQGSRLQMPAFDDHPFATPNIDERIQRPLANRDAEMQAMINGDYTVMDYWVGDAQVLTETVNENDHLSSIEATGDGRQQTIVQCGEPPFDDVAMRQALNAVIMGSQDTIINEIYSGFGVEAYSPVSVAITFWHNPETPFFEDGVEAARTILEDAGYEWDSDGNIYYPEE